jgi:autotransporter-associated beta strand protein
MSSTPRPSELSVQRRINAVLVAITIGILVLIARSSAHAGTQWWDTSATTGLQAGNGDWVNSNASTGRNWQTTFTPGTTSPARWTQGSDAIFSASGTSLVSVIGVDLQVNSMTFDGTGYTIGGTGTLILTGSNITTNVDGTISAPLSGTVGLTKLGTATLTLSGTDTYTGSTLISAGTLQVDASATTTGKLANTTLITVNSGGTLLLSGLAATTTDRINNAATVTLAGGILNTGGLSEVGGMLIAPTAGIGALTLTVTSTIDFGAGATSVIEFAGVGTQTNGTILQITNWNGVPGIGGGTERLLFAGTASDFTNIYSQNEVSFNGVTGYNVTQFTGYYEVTSVPEPSTWIGGALTLAAIGFTQRRRLRKLIPVRA